MAGRAPADRHQHGCRAEDLRGRDVVPGRCRQLRERVAEGEERKFAVRSTVCGERVACGRISRTVRRGLCLESPCCGRVPRGCRGHTCMAVRYGIPGRGRCLWRGGTPGAVYRRNAGFLRSGQRNRHGMSQRVGHSSNMRLSVMRIVVPLPISDSVTPILPWW